MGVFNSANAKELPALDAPQIDPKTEFFLTASHQFKSPVAIIQWCLQSLKEEESTFTPAQRKLINRALEQADGISALLSDTLQVFRLIHPKEDVQATPVRLNGIVDDLLREYAGVAEKQGVSLATGVMENLPPITGRETMLRQAVLNLIDNAIKYSPRGGRVTVSATTRNGNIELAVSDQGIGIPDAERSKLFTEFFRGQAAKEVAEGTGLGLVLVKHVVEQHGGSVHVDSQFQKGTTFTIQLPLTRS